MIELNIAQMIMVIIFGGAILSLVFEWLYKRATKGDPIEEAKQVLADNGYAVGNLWTEYDVSSEYEVTEEEALAVMTQILETEWLCGEINSAIHEVCRNLKYKKIKEIH